MRSAMIKRWNALGVLVFLAVLLLTTGGCAQKYTDYSSFVRNPQPLVTATEYRMAPPDTVLVMSSRVREINGQQQQVRPDGMISLPLLGTSFAAGKTCEELAEELRVAATDYYEDADVTVRVVGFNSKKIFVFGEVDTAGPYPYTGTNTILGTLARAQPNRLADVSRVQVLRPNKDGELIRRMTINLDDMVKRGDTGLDSVLEEGDIIYVPPTAMASLGLAFQQLLLPLQPAASTVNAPVNMATSFNSDPYGPQQTGGGY
ncbi:MAG: polysaccharide biosynthesis/export family protein [Phycisphaeraceae bacterium]|nr:polysaccharide biosynthesis/export family protein [Phycisphaeraceae bacterium]